MVVNNAIAGTATFVDGDTNNDDILQTGETWNYNTDYTTTGSDIGDLIATVTVTGDDETNQPVPPAQNTHTTTVSPQPTPAIAVATTGPTTALVGDTITSTIEIVNDDVAGDGTPIHNVVVTDNIAGDASFVEGDTNNDDILQTGETWNYTTNHTTAPTDLGDLVTTVTATGNDETNQPVPPAQNTHTTTVSPQPEPAITVTHSGPETALVGDTLTNTIEVTNDDVAGDGITNPQRHRHRRHRRRPVVR